jgi:hypothetical protein
VLIKSVPKLCLAAPERLAWYEALLPSHKPAWVHLWHRLQVHSITQTQPLTHCRASPTHPPISHAETPVVPHALDLIHQEPPGLSQSSARHSRSESGACPNLSHRSCVCTQRQAQGPYLPRAPIPPGSPPHPPEVPKVHPECVRVLGQERLPQSSPLLRLRGHGAHTALQGGRGSRSECDRSRPWWRVW